MFLSEIKTKAKISCTGFTVFQHPAKQGHRGGVALLIRPGLSKFIQKLDRSYENVLSFELSIVPDVIFIGCYIAPSDSPYYDAAVFGYVQCLLKRDESKKAIVMGDLNSRVGLPTNLHIEKEKCVYEGVQDAVVNKNGKCILDLCEETRLVVVNNLKHDSGHFKSKLSFRKKTNWISEPDLLLVSESCVQHLESFDMIQRYEDRLLYSDHALLDFRLDLKKMPPSTDILVKRACNLGLSVYECPLIKIDKSLRLGQCNEESLKRYFEENMPPPINEGDTVDNVLERFNSTIMKVLKESKTVVEAVTVPWGNAERWRRLLENNDLKKIWKSIGWDGGIEEAQVEIPSDEDFKIHFEQLLNPPQSENEDPVDVSDAPYIPLLDDPIEEVEVVEAAESCKESKSFVGITPAIFQCLPSIWILFITQILNMVFCSNDFLFPLKWCYNKLIVLFKKGARLNCGNYRGISIGDPIGKLYAKILGNRLKQWLDVQ